MIAMHSPRGLDCLERDLERELDPSLEDLCVWIQTEPGPMKLHMRPSPLATVPKRELEAIPTSKPMVENI